MPPSLPPWSFTDNATRIETRRRTCKSSGGILLSIPYVLPSSTGQGDQSRPVFADRPLPVLPAQHPAPNLCHEQSPVLGSR